MRDESSKIWNVSEIVALKRGCEATFAQFVKEYQSMVFACCRSVGLRGQDIEDAASETFLAAYTSIKRYDQKSKLSSWLWKIAYYKAIDHLRAQKKRPHVNSDFNTIESLSHYTDTHHENKERDSRIWEAVQSLAHPTGTIIVLYYRENSSVAEITEILGIPANTVKTHLHRGRKKLYSLLKDTWELDHAKQSAQ